MTTEGRALLDASEWMVQSTALLPTEEPIALSTLAFTLSPELQARADMLGEPGADIGAQLTEFISEALDLDVDIFGDSVAVLGPGDWSGEDSRFRRAVGSYGDLAGLRISSYDLADVIGEFRLPVFASQAKGNSPIEDWGTRAGAVVTAVAGVAPLVGGHTAALLVMIAPPLGTAVIVGTYGTIGVIAGVGYLKRRRREKRARKRAAEEARKQAEQAEKERQAREKEAKAAAADEQRRKSAERREALKREVATKPRPLPQDPKARPAE